MLFGFPMVFFMFLAVLEYCYGGESIYGSDGGNLIKVSMLVFFLGCYIG